jgi:hypothetical protein
MKKFLVILILMVFFASCENSEKISTDIDQLKAERTELKQQVNYAKQELININNTLAKTKGELIEMDLIKKGKRPIYIVKFQLKQSHLSLDLVKQLKDEMNAVEFEMPVDRDFYYSVTNGTNVVDEFRKGSLITEGSYGTWQLEVISKRIAQ